MSIFVTYFKPITVISNKNISESLQSRSMDFCMPWDKLKFNKGIGMINLVFIINNKVITTKTCLATKNYNFNKRTKRKLWFVLELLKVIKLVIYPWFLSIAHGTMHLFYTNYTFSWSIHAEFWKIKSNSTLKLY